MQNKNVLITMIFLFITLLTGCANRDTGSLGKKSYYFHGKTYHILSSSKGYQETGVASWCGKRFNHRRTSSGERYNMYQMTAAHKTLPLSTRVLVTNLRNGKKVIVRINDRGPFTSNRLIDLSYAAAKKIGMINTGMAKVSIKAIGHA